MQPTPRRVAPLAETPPDHAVAPPRPVMAFQIGITGHRALSDCNPQALQAAAAGLFRSLRAEVLRLYAADQASDTPLYQPTQPVLRVISGLAEGSDAILAEAALAEGWILVAALPFAHAEFVLDFEPGPTRERFQALLNQASVVCELDGSRRRGGEPYSHVGEQIIEQSDLLLAIWDGLPPRGPGGTGDVVQQAIERGLPTAILPVAGPVATTWRNVGAGGQTSILQAALLPPADDTGFPGAYFRDAPRGAGLARLAVRGFEATVLVGARSVETAATLPTTPAPDTDSALLSCFLPADHLATEYAARYRAAGLMRYGLILPATAGAFVAFYGPQWLQAQGFLLQFAALVAVLAFTTHGGWERAQGRFIAYRALAEYLRSARILAPLGAIARRPGAAAYQTRAADWTAWYERAVVRAAGLRSGFLDAVEIKAAAAFVRRQTQLQLEYLLNRAARCTAMARRLRLIGITLFLCGLGCEAIRTVLLLNGLRSGVSLWFNELSLILPALALIFLGLMSSQRVTRRRRPN
jgi:hypothetical protein